MNPFSLDNKVIVVTGASSGIGRAIAVEASRLGASIIALGRDSDRLKDVVDELILSGGSHSYYSFDITDEKECETFVSSVDIKIDGIVHSAGIVHSQLFTFLKKESFNKLMDVNFYSPIFLTKSLIKKKKFNKGSSIVFVSSISGNEISFLGGSAYSASKSAISGIAKAMALELSSKKIRVNCVLPGNVRTPLLEDLDSTNEDLKKDEANYPLGYGKPKDVAYACIYLISNASQWVTGTNLKLDGGYTLR